MSGIEGIDLKVAVIVRDGHALYAINAYFAWDRRTRVKLKVESLEEFWLALRQLDQLEYPDVVVLDAEDLEDARALSRAIHNLRDAIDGAIVICLAQSADLDLLYAAVEAGAHAFFLKTDVLLQIAPAVCYAQSLKSSAFVYSRGVAEAIGRLQHVRLRGSRELPAPRRYPDLTNRKREAIILYAIEGMPARLVADEMGIAESTARDYIKQAYRILESHHDDAGDYPSDMNQQEIAFMRLTALAEGDFNRE